MDQKVGTKRNVFSMKYERKLRQDSVAEQKAVRKCFEMDDNSWKCPGKKKSFPGTML